MCIWAKFLMDSFLGETRNGLGLQFKHPVRQNAFSKRKNSVAPNAKMILLCLHRDAFGSFFSNVQIDTYPTLAKSSEIILSVHHSIY